MISIHKELDDQKTIVDNYTNKIQDKLSDFELQKAVDLLADVLEMMNEKDRAPKKKIKPLIKEIQIALLNADDLLDELYGNLEDANFNTNDLLLTATDRLNAIDELYNDYKHYRKINITEFLDQLDKLIY